MTKTTTHTKKLNRNMKDNKYNKVIIFDLDETLGYFQELGKDTIQTFHRSDINLHTHVYSKHEMIRMKNHIFSLLEHNMYVFRNNIFKILRYIHNKKRRHKNIKVVLFTNNQGPTYWRETIIEFLHKRMKAKVFDKIIGPYKIGNLIIEKDRTSHTKSYSDVKRILSEKSNTQYLMLDDQNHDIMYNKNVKYLNVTPYYPYHINKHHHINNTYNIESEEIMRILKKFLSNDTKKNINKNDTRKKKNPKKAAKNPTQNSIKKYTKNPDVDKIVKTTSKTRDKLVI